MERIDRTGDIREYHAHVYYDADTRQQAADLRASVERRFPVQISPWSGAAGGPHLTAQYQITFTASQFSALVPFLMMNRTGLTLLVHPQSGRPRDDHTVHAMWMGKVLPAKADFPWAKDDN